MRVQYSALVVGSTEPTQPTTYFNPFLGRPELRWPRQIVAVYVTEKGQVEKWVVCE